MAKLLRLTWPILSRVVLCRYPSKKMSTVATTHDEVLKFWFNEQKTQVEKMKLWFNPSADQDKEIKETFGGLVLQARNGELANWEDLTKGVSSGLAFIILIDQFCRGIYRGTPDSFSHDPKALSVALKIIESNKHKEFSFFERQFLYLPLEHCENLEMQEKNVELFTELAKEAEGSDLAGVMQFGLEFAQQHHDVITKYGRFPKRNIALGRECTDKEKVDLKNWSYNW